LKTKKQKLEIGNSAMRAIEIYDTTLRDGAQMRGISFSVNDKLKVLRLLDDIGVAFVEGGWPGANPKDIDFFTEAKKIKLKTTQLVAFGSTRKANTKVESDPILAALLRAETEVICIVGKSSAPQVTNTLKISLEKNLDMLAESISFLKSEGRRVIIDAEHFFDGYVADSAYSLKFAKVAVEAGAETLVLCDTNGGSLPEQVFKITKEITEAYNEKLKIGIHAHNDCELAVANSIRAVRAGATQVQGTINGYGERCGNANLISIIPNLELKYTEEKLKCLPKDKLKHLSSLSHAVAEIANQHHSAHQPFVGASSFAHKAGLHASAMKKQDFSYEHIDPVLVGNATKIIISEQSGVSNILDWLQKKKLSPKASDEIIGEFAKTVLERVKKLEHKGYSFENADASLELMVRKLIDLEGSAETKLKAYKPYFKLVEHNVYISNGEKTEATVRIEIAGEEIHSASVGNGPANALDKALRKALVNFYPKIEEFQLLDYKVRIQDSSLGTAALTKVQVNTGNLAEDWDTIGVSTNIIKASWDAIVDSIEYGLIKNGVKPVGLA
jgi:2-isopropylmalate synthase